MSTKIVPYTGKSLKSLHYHLQLAITFIFFSQVLIPKEAIITLNATPLQEHYSDLELRQRKPTTHLQGNVHPAPQSNLPNFSDRPQAIQNLHNQALPPNKEPIISSHPKPSGTANLLSSRLTSPSNPQLGSVNMTVNNPDLDSLSEGSGNGPLHTHRKQKEKFDDTEEGDDDDDDDEDDGYDYKDSGSGLGNELPSAKKTDNAVFQGNNQLKKPDNQADPYVPFRLPSHGQSVNATIESHTLTAPPVSFTISSTTHVPSFQEVPKNNTINPEETNMSAIDVKFSSPPQIYDQLEKNETRSTTPLPAIQKYDSTSVELNYNTQESTVTPKLYSVVESNNYTSTPTTSTTTIHPFIFYNKTQVPYAVTTATKPVSNELVHRNISGSLTHHSTTSKPTDIDYDYEEESDDEDSEDTSNFEDNESIDSLLANRTTSSNVTSVQPPFIHRLPTNTSKPTVPTRLSTITTELPKVSISPIEQPAKTAPSNPWDRESNQSNPIRNLPNNKSTTIKPVLVPSSTVDSKITNQENENLGDDDDDDIDDDDEEEEEEEIIEEEIDDEGEEEKVTLINHLQTSGQGALDNSNQNILTSSLPRLTTRPPLPFLPNHHDSLDANLKLSKNILLSTTSRPTSHTSQSNTGQNFQANRPMITHPPAILSTITVPTVTIAAYTPTTPKPATSTISTVISRPTIVPFITTSTTIRVGYIRYATTPRSRTIPSTRTSNIMPFDREPRGDEDVSLTRQIYDKAIEMYHTSSKAANSAIDAIWPPTFELNSNTFEPLFAQPLLFMLVIGATIIGIVLTMMLVVYIVTYQIQPKDDVSIY